MSQSPAYGVGDASYQAAGGIDGLQRLVDDFYTLMDERPEAAVIRAMHPESLQMARDKLACFLSGWLGGPRLFSERYGPIAIPAFHAQWPIQQEHATLWLACMAQAIARQPYAPAFAGKMAIEAVETQLQEIGPLLADNPAQADHAVIGQRRLGDQKCDAEGDEPALLLASNPAEATAVDRIKVLLFFIG